jgi:hypothetical protein
MSRARAGRLIAAIGVICGFAAIWTDFLSVLGSSASYGNDGTVLAFLLVTLVPTALLIVVGAGRLDAVAAVLGSAACGFYLFIPAGYGFNHLGFIAAGGWLGVCTVLIPIGLWTAMSARPAQISSLPARLALWSWIGRALCLAAIWTTAIDGASYWNLGDKGRALPALMLVLVLGGGVLVTATRPSGPRTPLDGALAVAAATFGLYAALAIGNAFEDFGVLDVGAWLGTAGGTVLLVAVAGIWRRAVTLAA